MKRLFMAIPFEDSLQEALYLQATDIKASFGGRAVRRGNYHLTLRFFGSCGPAEEHAARQVLASLAFRAPFELHFAQPGQFVQGRQTLIWMGIADQPELNGLFADLTAKLEPAGFPVDKKPFRPHVTLLRDVSNQSGKPLPLWTDPPLIQVDSLVLFESITEARGLTYCPLARSHFAAGDEETRGG